MFYHQTSENSVANKLALISVHLYYTLFLVTANNGIEGKRLKGDAIKRSNASLNYIQNVATFSKSSLVQSLNREVTLKHIKIWKEICLSAKNCTFIHSDTEVKKKLKSKWWKLWKNCIKMIILLITLRIAYIYVHLIFTESKYLKYRRPQLQKEGVKTRHLSYIG